MKPMKLLLNGDEAFAAAAYDAGVALGTGYPGTPSTEISRRLNSLEEMPIQYVLEPLTGEAQHP
jgi:TPP-dependent indolepyruvate ferredoxin oxidoreductase alpha subunit